MRGLRKVMSVFLLKSEPQNASSSTTKAEQTKLVRGSQPRPARADTGNASTGFEGCSSAFDTATITSGPGIPKIAIPSDLAVPALSTSPGLEKPTCHADATITIPQIAVAETANGSAPASSINQASSDGRIAQPQLWLRAKHAPIWNEALQTLKEENPKMHKELEETKNSLLESREMKADEFFELDTAKPEERAVVQRWKQYLPSLAAARGIAMTAAALDPHKIAPIVCACVFFSIDVRALSEYQRYANQVSLLSTPFRQMKRVRCEVSYSRVSLLSTNGCHSNLTSEKKVMARSKMKSEN